MDLDERLMASLDSGRMRLIIMPTEQCNFRCTYCYEDFEMGRMPAEVELGIERLITERIPELHTLWLDWFGGEPLLALPSITRIAQLAQGLCERSDTRFISSATTNGWLLTPDHLAQLVGSGVTRFQVTLDGYGATHDETRKSIGGGGSFDRIWRNLREARDSDLGFTVSLRIHMAPSNAAELPRLVDAVGAEFGADRRFSVLFKAVGHYHGPCDDHFPVLNKQQEAALRRGLMARLPDALRGRTIVPGAGYICYASEPNALVVRADGRIAKCTVALGDSRNDVGRVHSDGSLAMDQAKVQAWFRGIESGDPRELGCPYSTMGADPGLVTIGARPS